MLKMGIFRYVKNVVIQYEIKIKCLPEYDNDCKSEDDADKDGLVMTHGGYHNTSPACYLLIGHFLSRITKKKNTPYKKGRVANPPFFMENISNLLY
jgi:hypothetical protein